MVKVSDKNYSRKIAPITYAEHGGGITYTLQCTEKINGDQCLNTVTKEYTGVIRDTSINNNMRNEALGNGWHIQGKKFCCDTCVERKREKTPMSSAKAQRAQDFAPLADAVMAGGGIDNAPTATAAALIGAAVDKVAKAPKPKPPEVPHVTFVKYDEIGISRFNKVVKPCFVYRGDCDSEGCHQVQQVKIGFKALENNPDAIRAGFVNKGWSLSKNGIFCSGCKVKNKKLEKMTAVVSSFEKGNTERLWPIVFARAREAAASTKTFLEFEGTCSCCRKAQKHGVNADSIDSEERILHRFQSNGYLLNREDHTITCKECRDDSKKPTSPPKMPKTGGIPMTTNKMTPKLATLDGQPSVPVLAAKRQLKDLLDHHLEDVPKKPGYVQYCGDWSDAKVAAETKLHLEFIKTHRDEWYGQLLQTNPEVLALQEKQAKLETDCEEMLSMLQGFQKEIAQVRAALKKITG